VVQYMSNSKRVGRLVAVGAAGLVAMAATATGSGADTLSAANFTLGQASATAQSLKVNPSASGLSLGITFGIALAGFQNNAAKADSRGIDLGIIGTTLGGQGCDGSPPSYPNEDQPQPLVADSQSSDSGGAAKGYTDVERFKSPNGKQEFQIPAMVKNARASNLPFAEATTLTGPVGGPGVFEIDGARSDSVTQVVKGATREARATSDIAALNIANDAVVLKGLHWEAVNHSGSDNTESGSFTIGGLTVGGMPVALPQDSSAAIDVVNQILNEVGIILIPPTVHSFPGRLVIDPLSIAVVSNTQRDSLANNLLGSDAYHSVREQITNAILTPPLGSCSNGTYITIGDVAIGSVTGGGSFSLELGGVQVSSSAIKLSHNLLDLPPLPSIDSFPDVASQLPAVDVLGSTTLPETGGAVAPATSTNRGGSQPIQAASIKGKRGGKLALLAAGTLLLLAGVAAGDWNKMRKAQRMIVFDV